MNCMRTALGNLLILVLGAGACIGLVGCASAPADDRPLIGITSVYQPADTGPGQVQVPFTYVQAVEANGGVPLVLPAIDADETIDHYVRILDALVLIGGDDIPPDAYGRDMHPTMVVMPQRRYHFERRLVERWWATGKPLLGVCLGMQLVNVVRGGTLIQDIPSQIGTEIVHRKTGGSYHTVRIDTGSELAWRLGASEVTVLSNHHQAVDRLGRGLRVVARGPDGVIEALERTDGPFGLFVQWHPESMADTDHRDAIYGALIDACTPRSLGARRP